MLGPGLPPVFLPLSRAFPLRWPAKSCSKCPTLAVRRSHMARPLADLRDLGKVHTAPDKKCCVSPTKKRASHASETYKTSQPPRVENSLLEKRRPGLDSCFRVGASRFRAWHTPRHAPEVQSMCALQRLRASMPNPEPQIRAEFSRQHAMRQNFESPAHSSL